VYRVACYTCATPEYYDVVKRDTDNYISGGAISKNLTESGLTFISENMTRPMISGVLSVGEGVWPARPLTEGIDFHTCVMVRTYLEQTPTMYCMEIQPTYKYTCTVHIVVYKFDTWCYVCCVCPTTIYLLPLSSHTGCSSRASP